MPQERKLLIIAIVALTIAFVLQLARHKGIAWITLAVLVVVIVVRIVVPAIQRRRS